MFGATNSTRLLIIVALLTAFYAGQKVKPSRITHFPKEPRRIVSLEPTITELVYFVGAGEKLVGVTRYCDYPEDVRNKKIVGGISDPDIETLLLLKPDMVLMSSDNSLQLLDWLRELGLNVRVIDTEIANDLEGLCGVIKEVGDATGKLSVALERISELRQEILVLNQKFNLGEARPAVFLSLYGPALWTAGRKTFLNDIIIRAGASNIADFREGFFRLSIEDLIMRDPDIIIIPARNEEECADYQRGMFSLPGIYRLRAIRTGSLYCLKEENILRPSPRLLIALEELVNIIQN